MAIQQSPAPTFSEQQRGVFILEHFKAEGLSDVDIDSYGNVYARLPGSGTKPPLVLTAHMDTVFLAGTDLTLRREGAKVIGPGIGDNSLGVAGLFGGLWAIRERRLNLPGDVWFVANVCEEGLGDLKGMRAIVDRFGDRVQAYLILEGMALGQIYHRGLGVQRYRISVHTKGGHSWVDYGRPSAIHILASLINRLVELPLPSQPRTTLNVGGIQGGTTVNTIAAQASLELDLRSEDSHILKELTCQVQDLVKSANRTEVEVVAEIIGARPAGKIAADHPLVQLAKRCLEAQSLQPSLGIGSTDANIPLSKGLPAICIGISNGSGAHTNGELVYIRPIEKGLEQLINLIEGVFRI